MILNLFDETFVKCISDVKLLNEKYLFRKNKEYKVRIFGEEAVIKDEIGCWRNLYNKKSNDFYKKNFEILGVNIKKQEYIPVS